MNSYHEILTECAEKLSKAFQELSEQALELWEKMKEKLEGLEPEPVEIPEYNWHVPQRIILKNQVLNRKPRMVVARSTC